MHLNVDRNNCRYYKQDNERFQNVTMGYLLDHYVSNYKISAEYSIFF